MFRIQSLVLVLIIFQVVVQNFGKPARSEYEFVAVHSNRNGPSMSSNYPRSNEMISSNNSMMSKEDEANKQAKLFLNLKRADHGTQPLQFCQSSKALARECANSYVEFQSSNHTRPHLKNLNSCFEKSMEANTAVYFYETTNKQEIAAVSEAVRDWYDEVDGSENGYDYENPVKDTLFEFQHKTQIIWNNTEAFGSACSPIALAPLEQMAHSRSTSSSGSGASKKKEPKSYICSFTFVPAGNIRRGFNDEELDEYKKNVPAPLDS